MIGFDGAKFDGAVIERINHSLAELAQQFAAQTAGIAKAARAFDGWESTIARWRDDYLAEEAFRADGGDPEFIAEVERAYGVEW